MAYRFPILLSCGLWLLFVTQAMAQVIEANNTRSSLLITASDTLRITISHDGSSSNQPHDWWIAAATTLPAPDNLFYFNGSNWTTDLAVAYQQPLQALQAREVLSVSGLPPASYTFYFGTDPLANGILELDQLSYDAVVVTVQASQVAPEQSCGSSKALFTVAPLAEDAYFEIDPLGATNPSGHTFPTVHTYMMLSNSQQARSVYAPGNITLTQVKAMQNLSVGGLDYALQFSPCTEVSAYFDHVSSLNQTIANQLGDAADCREYLAGSDLYRLCHHNVSIEIAAGEIIGTAGALGQGSAALDFGLRDTRNVPLYYANPDRLVNSDQLYVACPYDYFESGPVKETLLQKLGNARQTSPECGGVAQDVAATAQGRWYLAGTSDFSENDHLALVSSNRNPDVAGVLSVGNSSIGTDAYYFTFAETGLVNRRFDAITDDGHIYCFDSLRNRAAPLIGGNSQPLTGILYLQLLNDSQLRLQRNTLPSSCPTDTASLIFTEAAVTFQR